MPWQSAECQNPSPRRPYCVPKCSKPATELDYRSIALLNSNYKIFTRILATRLAKVLDVIVQDSQSGFIPGRSIHDTIDLAFVAKHLANAGQISRDALVLLLDSVKLTTRSTGISCLKRSNGMAFCLFSLTSSKPFTVERQPGSEPTATYPAKATFSMAFDKDARWRHRYSY